MTKRRPSWSDRLRRVVAALLCGLLLLNVPSSVWAAAGKASPRSANVVRQARYAHPAVRTSVRRQQLAAEEIVTADEVVGHDQQGLHGLASFYGYGFQGRRTANGETFDVRNFTAASNRFPLGTLVAVRRLDTGRCVVVKINDRMHVKHKRRIIDLSRGVAEYLDMLRAGVVLERIAPLRTAAGVPNACQTAFEPTTPECTDCDAGVPKLAIDPIILKSQ